jgi:hypothetical protein
LQFDVLCRFCFCRAVAPEANEDEKAAEPVTEEFAADTEPSSELRQRKPFNTDNIPDID